MTALAALAKGNFAWGTAGGRELALFALERAARTDPSATRAAWVKWRDKLPDADRRYGSARLAYHAARMLNPAANDYFREAGDVRLVPEAQAWRVRAALRAVAWDDVLAAIDGMSDAQRQETTWRYWRGRALVALGRAEEGRLALASVAIETNFYGMLAGEALGQKFMVPASLPLEPLSGALTAFGERSAVRRVVKLAELDMRSESAREWGYVVRGLPDDELLLAADYARRAGLYDRAINTAERTQARHDFGLRYLAPYRNEFDAAARANDIDVAILYGIARQESRFNVDIVSSAGAIGLMQLMPGTAKWVAKQMSRNDFRPAQTGDPDTNTQFGAFYFKYWLDRLDRMPALAAAAYNAGPGRAQAWRPVAPLEGAIWVETIPFNETRDYVKKGAGQRRDLWPGVQHQRQAVVGPPGHHRTAWRDARQHCRTCGAVAGTHRGTSNHRRPGRQRLRGPLHRGASRRARLSRGGSHPPARERQAPDPPAHRRRV